MMKEVLHRIAILLTGVIVGILFVIVFPLGITGCSSDNSSGAPDDVEEAIEVPPSSSSGCELFESVETEVDTMYVMDEMIVDTTYVTHAGLICDGDTVDNIPAQYYHNVDTLDVPEYDGELN